MDLLKRIPIRYIGELHDIRLINFSVEKDELLEKIPHSIKIRDINNRALISMVDVKLKKMHPSFLPSWLSFNYRHIAFRLLIEDKQFNNGIDKGIFFYRSFTDKPLIVAGGRLMTDYNLEVARISERSNEVIMEQGPKYLKYKLDGSPVNEVDSLKKLRENVGSIDRAYSLLGKNLRVTQIQREKWPIEWVNCAEFKTNFFETAKLEGSFKVNEVIHYQWLPPKTLLR
jgi:hypothetical protein